MLDDDYDERLAKEVLENWSTIRLSAYNRKISKEASSTWAAIEERIGAFSDTTSANGRYRKLITVLTARDNEKTPTFSFRPPSAEESFRNIYRLFLEAKAERETSELEFALAVLERFRQDGPLGMVSLKAHAEASAKELREVNAFVKNANDVVQIVRRALKIDPSRGHSFSRAQILYRHMRGLSTNLSQCVLPSDHLTDRFNIAIRTTFRQSVLRKRIKRRPRNMSAQAVQKSGAIIKLKKTPRTRAQRKAALENVEVINDEKPPAGTLKADCKIIDTNINADVKPIPQVQTPIEVKTEIREEPTDFSTQSHSDTLTNSMTEDDDDDPFEQTLLLLDEADLLGDCYSLVQEARKLLDANPDDLESKKQALQKFSVAFKALKTEIKTAQNEEVASKRRRGLEMMRSLHSQNFSQVFPSLR